MTSAAKIPARPGGKRWTFRHTQAARYRALGWSWEAVSREIGVTDRTARNYTQLDGFDALVRHFAEARFREVDDGELRRGQEALIRLDALSETMRDLFERKLAAVLDDEDMRGLSMVLELAARLQILDSTIATLSGHATYRQQLAKALAVGVDAGDDDDDLTQAADDDGLTDAELARRYKAALGSS